MEKGVVSLGAEHTVLWSGSRSPKTSHSQLLSGKALRRAQWTYVNKTELGNELKLEDIHPDRCVKHHRETEKVRQELNRAHSNLSLMDQTD